MFPFYREARTKNTKVFAKYRSVKKKEEEKEFYLKEQGFLESFLRT